MKYYTKEYLIMKDRLYNSEFYDKISSLAKQGVISAEEADRMSEELDDIISVPVEPYRENYNSIKDRVSKDIYFNGCPIKEFKRSGNDYILKVINNFGGLPWVSGATFKNTRIIEKEEGFEYGTYICDEIYITGGYYEFHAIASRVNSYENLCPKSRYACLTLICTDIIPMIKGEKGNGIERSV